MRIIIGFHLILSGNLFLHQAKPLSLDCSFSFRSLKVSYINIVNSSLRCSHDPVDKNGILNQSHLSPDSIHTINNGLTKRTITHFHNEKIINRDKLIVLGSAFSKGVREFCAILIGLHGWTIRIIHIMSDTSIVVVCQYVSNKLLRWQLLQGTVSVFSEEVDSIFQCVTNSIKKLIFHLRSTCPDFEHLTCDLDSCLFGLGIIGIVNIEDVFIISIGGTDILRNGIKSL